MKVDILGVKIDKISKIEALEIVEHWIWNNPACRIGKHYIVTPNPEFLVAAQKDPEFKKILNNADLAIPDGAGLRLTGDIESTISGVDFMEELIKLAAEKGFVTGFLGGGVGVAEKTAECLQKKYKNLKVAFTESGGEVNRNGVILRESVANREVTFNNIPPLDLLFVAFGHIKQEKWIANNLEKIPVKVMMGVGGAFDYLSGNVLRAPKWVRSLGLEWLFRLVLQPWRIKRQLSLFMFLWLIIVRGNK